ncbi:putative substrate binding domain-containing protein [Erysiphe necator]|uniref:Putative substrate binding domain-containing protein n=1 Tax=Uncinula necator TaxID=52586 RepID=A0A0B1PG17_UNCNE|nr:putative substrate binding domain-containing protein [Erysiphe necator]
MQLIGMKNKVLITGATGFLGRQMMKSFEQANWEVTGTGLTRAVSPIIKLDLLDSEAVARIIRIIQPCVVVHCAANRYPDKCSNDPEGTYALNVGSTSSLAATCAAQDILLLYISTDYVFSGKLGEAPYEVDSKPDPSNFYGVTKLKGENSVLDTYENAGMKGLGVILRVPVMYGEVKTPSESAVNVLLDTLLEARKKNRQVFMDHWAIRYPTNTEDIARISQDVASKYIATNDKSKLPLVLQYTSEQRYTKYEMCSIFAKIMDLPQDNIIPIETPNDDTPRPYDCHLSTKQLREIGINVCSVDFEDWWRREAEALRT